MSATKHRSLSRRIAWLRLAGAAREDGGGFAVNVKWGHAVTADVERLAADGHLVASREASGDAKRTTTYRATPAGRAFFRETLERHGPDFGPIALARASEPDRPGKQEARRRRAPIVSARERARIRTAEKARIAGGASVRPLPQALAERIAQALARAAAASGAGGLLLGKRSRRERDGVPRGDPTGEGSRPDA